MTHEHESPYAPPATAHGRPAVITAYRVFAIAQPLVYALAVAVWAARASASAAPLGGVIVVVALLGAFYALAALVPYKPWGWTLGLVAIGLGLATCLAPAAIALLVYWFRPETKAAFCRI